MSWLTIILGGLLARLDGWGGGITKLGQLITKYASVWLCGALFGLLFIAQPIVALIAAGAFIIFRAPGFHQWENWRNMFIRGLWTSAIGYAVLGAYTGHYWAVLLALPMGTAEALSYSGTYNYLVKKLPEPWLQPVAEISSGIAFTALFMAAI